MTDFKKFYSFIFIIFSCFVFGETNVSSQRKNVDFFKQPSQKITRNPLLLNPQRIISKNKNLSKNINRYFRKKQISKKDIQKFLIKHSYYQSEVVRSETAYIIENPVKTIFVFKGNHFFNEKKIRRFAKIDENRAGALFYSFVEAAIKKAYQNQGFLKIKIKKSTVRKKWKEWIYLNISEGPRIRIAELKIKGLLSQPNSQYESFIKNNSADLIKKGFYSKKDLEIGYKNLINHLKSQGYLQSKIYSDRIFVKKDKAFITINLEEGPLTIIRDIQIQNTRALPIWEILSHIQSRIQSPLQINLVLQDLDSIERLYKSKGYLSMKITNKENIIQYIPGERYASIVIQIDEGPKAFISKIFIKGLRKAKEKMVRDLLKFKAGDILTPLKKEQAIQSLGATGLFTDMSFTETMKGNQLEVSALFKERKPRSLGGGFGANSQRGFTLRAYSEMVHRNLFGWGRALIAKGSGQINLTQWEPFLEYEVLGRYKEVFIPGYGYQGDISLSQSQSIFNYSIDNIDFVKKTQISFFINKSINKNLKMRWNIWSFENRRAACTQAVCPENPQQIGSTNFNVVWDKRDNIFNPSGGILSSFTAELSLPLLGSSSDIAFAKADFQNQLYWTFMKNYTLGLTLKGGLIHVIQNSQYIPVSRSFILGGQNSVRGYDGDIEGERIPSKKYALIETANAALQLQKEGVIEQALASRYGVLNIDFRFPLFKDFKGVLFYDLGVVYLEGQNKKVLDYGHSVGIGFRYQTFLIPIGLDIAYKLRPAQTAKASNYRFHFSIGW